MTRTPKTNQDYSDIKSELPASVARHAAVVQMAIMHAAEGRNDESFAENAAELRAYRMTHVAAVAWMEA